MLKQKYFLTGIFILSAERQPIKLAWRKIVWLLLKLIDNSLRDIIENFVPPHNMPNWKIQLIKDPALLDKNTSHYIAIPEDNSYCYLLKSKRPRDIDGSIKIK